MRKKNKLVFGLGVNDADYLTNRYGPVEGKRKLIWICPFYMTWKNMLMRCYYKPYHKKRPTYSECSVFQEWHYFMTFRSWMETQDWEGKALDKDLLIPGNKIYGPDTCVFVTQEVNLFINDKKKNDSDLPIGVYFSTAKGKFCSVSRFVNGGKSVHLGSFDSAIDAFQAWISFKHQQAVLLASIQENPRVAFALLQRYKNYEILY